MVLYLIYKRANKKAIKDQKLPELAEQIVDVVKLSTMVAGEVNLVNQLDNEGQDNSDKIEKKGLEVIVTT